MKRFWRALDWIVARLKTIGAACLVGMTFLTCADVVGRFFRHPIFGAVEIVGFMATLEVAMALPYTHREKGHIGVEILFRTFSPRWQRIVDLCTSLLSLGLFVLITWRMGVYGLDLQKSGEVSMNLQFPAYLIVYAVGFCFLIFVLTIVRDFFEKPQKAEEEK